MGIDEELAKIIIMQSLQKLQLLFCVMLMVWQHKFKNQAYVLICVFVAFNGMQSQLSLSLCVCVFSNMASHYSTVAVQ